MKITRILRPGIVEKRENNRLTVLLNPRDMKSSCAEKGCNACTHSLNPTTIHFKEGPEEVAEGDTVVVSSPIINEAVGAFLVFIVPILISILYFFVVTGLFKWSGEEPKTIVSTLVVLFAGFGAPTYIDSILRRVSPPKIESVERKSKK